ncbi:hypothetical protein RRG08_029873 [Elysia crispata]|uniref:Uncharacterized protein n=1 Tax=Elysia crispata TaxID=231223 RepID=A0AAE1CZX3_9GAST|nr:hypothetical protein RRG08_029873 [Elysia crispata]
MACGSCWMHAIVLDLWSWGEARRRLFVDRTKTKQCSVGQEIRPGPRTNRERNPLKAQRGILASWPSLQLLGDPQSNFRSLDSIIYRCYWTSISE